jgi:outer membrane lipoprotein carrier protein
MRTIKIMLIVLFIFLPISSFAQTAPEQLITTLQNINSLQANFKQTVYDGSGNALQATQGTLALSRPGKFRWETTTPAHQLLIADGKRIWFYDVDLAQVTVQRQQALQNGSPAMLLSGSVQKLAQDFSITTVANNANSVTYQLVPHSNKAMFQQVQLQFTNNKLRSMKLMDNLNQSTIVLFSNVQNNPNLDANLFVFTTPKGVDVVTQ